MKLESKKICPFCQQAIAWFQVVPDGRKIPVNVQADPKGALILDEKSGWLTRVETFRDVVRYRSHLLDCKQMAKSLHSTRNITIPKDVACEYADCKQPQPHFHCFKCGETGHYASVCENETPAKELDFGN